MTTTEDLPPRDHPMSVSFRSVESVAERSAGGADGMGQNGVANGSFGGGADHDDDWARTTSAMEEGGEVDLDVPLGRLDESDWESNAAVEDDEGGSRGLNGSAASSTSTARAGGGDGSDEREGGDRGGNDDGSVSIPPEIRESLIREDRKVRRLKVVVVVILIAAAVVVTVLVYTSTKNSEREDCETQYDHVATKITDSFRHNMDMKIWTAYTLSAVYTGRCKTNFDATTGSRFHDLAAAPWPNVTLPDFDEQTRGILALAHALDVSFSPLVSVEEREGWEAYATAAAGAYHASHGHVEAAAGTAGAGMAGSDNGGERAAEAATAHAAHSSSQPASGGGGNRHLRGVPVTEEEEDEGGGGSEATQGMGADGKMHGDVGDDNDHGPDHPVRTSIFRIEGSQPAAEDDPLGPLAPLWQIAPMEGNEMAVMYNLRSDPTHRRAIDGMLLHSMPAMTEVIDQSTVDYHTDPHYHASPSSSLYYPVYDTFQGSEKSIVGMIGITFSWDATFSDLLPVNIRGITCVLETNTGQQFTYRIDGETATLVGEGDLHERQFDQYMHIYENDIHTLGDHNHHSHRRRAAVRRAGGRGAEERHGRGAGTHEFFGRRHARTTAQVSNEGGADNNSPAAHDDGLLVSYTLRVYPSSDFVATYHSNQPVIYAVSVGLIFFVTVMTFILYDCFVERRQMKVMTTAVRSTKLVNSLFPAVVRDRVFQSQQEEAEMMEDRSQSQAPHEGKKKTGVKRMLPRKMSDMMMHQQQDASVHLKRFLTPASQDDDLTAISGSLPPIADLFPDTTVMFGDIAGFTAWSSEREPAQVFQLLEALFREFDLEAKKQGVFKVETIGDCYVAVAGLPEPRPDHALAMARFAQRCLVKFGELTKELELSLGPGTAELGMRIGLHSGPTTAGVLRGDKSRFQLFGDTMNTASRMESTGIKNMIQLSNETAALLRAAGKGHCLVLRDGGVHAKGKGVLHTYWLRPKAMRRNSSQYSGGALGGDAASQPSIDDVDKLLTQAEEDNDRAELGLPPAKQVAPLSGGGGGGGSGHGCLSQCGDVEHARPETMPQLVPLASIRDESWKDTGLDDYGTDPGEGLQRLVKWNTAVLESILAKGIVHRENRHNRSRRNLWKSSRSILNLARTEDDFRGTTAVFSEEIAEAVDFPRFDSDAAYDKFFCKSSVIPPQVRKELHDYVTRVASMYTNVHFHNFEHASHVTMSANKLINKVCSRNGGDYAGGNGNGGEEKKTGGDDREDLAGRHRDQVELFFSTFGISADFLAQFAVVFAALVHDVGHTGVPNVQLIKEKPELALRYRDKSVAENNSIAVAWSILQERQFENLRKCIFAGDGDESRFRQLLINVVIATDIADKERRAGERKRWEKAFDNVTAWQDEWQSLNDAQLAEVDVSLKATVVLEQIVLASDVAHTMQHWLTYVKWNERLYRELWSAHKNGRAESDPTANWYEGEIGFFNGYIIPLASKLKECGVFGTAGDEYLGNALRNRDEWIEKGRKITARFEETIKYAE